MPNRTLQVELVSSKAVQGELREELLSLCSQAYEEDFSAYLELLSPAMHLLGRINDELVSHVAWVERELRVDDLGALSTAYVEAVATLPSHQRRGYAHALLARVPPLVRQFDLAALSPSDPSFYRPLGWEMWEGPLSYIEPAGNEVTTPEEQLMIYRLPATPASLDVRAKLTVDWRPLEVW
jgi:aminoglycoside 2'-N-acetyltransferase I